MNLVRLSKSSVGEEEKGALARVIDAGYLGMGREVQLFEEELRAQIGTEMDVICVNSGTAALHLAVHCLGIGPGDEVLVPSITYVASFQAISATGARPISCDVTADTAFLDIADAARRVTPRTRAIMPVHYASDSSNMAAVYSLAQQHGLRVIEDAAHAFGGTRAGQRIGVEGDVLCFSFDGIKNITCGEGGAVVTGDAELASRIKDARLLGVERDTEKRYQGQRSWLFDVRYQGYRYHMSNLMAAIGRAQLGKLARFAHQRQERALRYRAELQGIESLVMFDLDYQHIIPHIFPVRIVNGKRDAFMDYLRSIRIETGVHYKPNHLLTYFATDYRLAIAERLGAELLSLPLHPELTIEDQNRVISEVKARLKQRST